VQPPQEHFHVGQDWNPANLPVLRTRLRVMKSTSFTLAVVKTSVLRLSRMVLPPILTRA
jgi:hypothetical protein